MKRLITFFTALLLAIILIASSWPTTTIVALECENSVANTGHGSYTFSYGAGTYSSVIKQTGSYSAGPIITTAGAITSNSNITDIVQQVQFWAYHLSTGQATIGATYYNSHSGSVLYVYANQMYLFDPVDGQIGGFSFTMNAGHLWILDYDGTHIDLWLDGVHQGQMTAYQFLGNDGVVFGARNAGEDCDCYFDNIILDTHNNTGVEITPIPMQTPPVIGNRIVGYKITFSNGLHIVSMIGDQNFQESEFDYQLYLVAKPAGITITPINQ